MAYSTIDVEINGVTIQAIDVSGDGVDIIPEQSLTNYDKTIMDAVSEEDGATFADKLEAYTHPNGVNGAVLYANYIVDAAAFNLARVKASADTEALAVAVGTLSGQVADLETVSDDHEARIVVLETP